MNLFFNLDLLFNGINIVAITILGFLVFINDRSNKINKAFGAFSLTAIFYAVINYFSYNITNEILILWLLRLVLFSSVLYSFVLFHFIYIFSNSGKILPRIYKYILIPATIGVAIMTLSPLAFPRLSAIAPIGQVTNPERGPGMAIFGAAVMFFVFGSIFILLKKVTRTKEAERRQF